jgi:hypothetical protein
LAFLDGGYEPDMTPEQSPGLPAYPIAQRLEIEGVNVVLLAVPPEQNYPQNVFGLNAQGDVLWQVEPRSSEEPRNRYLSLRDEVGIVVAVSEDHYQRKIDAKTGKVLQEERTD